MKIFSYTKMRDELTDVLDALRRGESVKITQRGKADIVISAQTGMGFSASHSPSKGHWRAGKTSNSRSPGITVTDKNKVVMGIGLTFEEAKSRTQKKHAGIIKALEDK